MAKNKDMTVPCDDGLINIRVGAIIMKNGRFLMVGNERADYLFSVSYTRIISVVMRRKSTAS